MPDCLPCRAFFSILIRLAIRGILGPHTVGTLILAGLVATCSFGPIARSAARSRAAKRHVALEIGGVRPGWFAVRLLRVVARPEAMPSVGVRIDDVRVGLGLWFRVDRVELHGVAVEALGDLDHLRDELVAWRGLGQTDAVEARDPTKSTAPVAFSEPSGSTMVLAPTMPILTAGLSCFSNSANFASVGKDGVLVWMMMRS